MLLGMAAKLAAQQKNGIEVKNLNTQTSGLQSENHQFEIVAHEETDVNLKFTLKAEDNIDVTVKDGKSNTILIKKFQKAGENKLNFTMQENEKYMVELIGEKQSNLIVMLSKN